MPKNPFESPLLGEIKKKPSQNKQGYEWEETLVDTGSFRPQTIKPLFDFDKLKWVYFLILFTFLIIFSRLFYLQIVLGETLREAAEENRYRVNRLPALRGVVYDRDNNLLVKNIPAFDVVVIPADLPKNENEKNKIWEELKSLIDIKAEELEILTKEIDYSSFQPFLIKKNIPRNQALILETKINEFAGIKIEKNPIREYAFPDDFSHILGYVGKISEEEFEENKKQNYQLIDYIGKDGIEKKYENNLRGINGMERVEVDSKGNIKKVVASQESIAGQNLILTINKDLQIKSREALERGMRSAHSKKGTVVILNPKNGEILSLVSMPSYNNNIFNRESKDSDYGDLISNSDQPLFNRTIGGLYPPASTIKPVMVAAGLEEGIITSSTIINDAGAIDVPNKYDPSVVYRFVSWDRSGLGLMNLFSAIAMSSDIYFYYIGGGFKEFRGLGAEKIVKYFKDFGLGRELGVDLPAEAGGLIPTPEWKKKIKNEEWYLGDTYHISIGQGDLLATPLQVASYTATVANGGKLFRPFIVKEIIDNNKNIVQENKEEIIREGFIKDDNIRLVKRGMRETVLSGSAKSLSSLPYEIAGKTGTAQHGGSDKTHAWFTAFAPYEHPEIVVVVLVEDGGEGSAVAVPIASEILEWYFNDIKT
jgi:penicillin-binding protein 2